MADDPAAEIAQYLTDSPAPPAPARTTTGIVVSRHSDADVLEAHAEAHLESLNSLIARLPAETSNEYETYIQSVIEQCVKAELLAANSWRVAVNAGGAESVDRLMTHLTSLEAIRTGLLARMPGSLSARFDQACTRSDLPEPVIATLIGGRRRAAVGHPQPRCHPARCAPASQGIRRGEQS